MTPNKPAPRFAFGPRNYRLMWIGLAALAAGFITMMFGDKENYGEDFVGITLGPLLLLIGFGIEFAAILVRDKTLTLSTGIPAVATGAASDSLAPTPVAPVAAPAYKRL